MDKRKSYIKHIDFILADFIIAQLSFLLASFIWAWMNGRVRPEFGSQYWHQAALLVLCVAASVIAGEPYKDILKRNKYQEISACARHTLKLLILHIFLIFFVHEGGNASRLTVAIAWVIYFFAEIVFRLFWKRMLRKRILTARHRSGSSLILITDSEHAEELVQGLQTETYSPYFVRAVFLTDGVDPEGIHSNGTGSTADSDCKTQIAGIPVLGNVEESIRFSANHWVDEVVIGSDDREIEQHFERMGITTHRVLLKVPDAWQTGTASVDKYGDYLVTTHVLRNVPMWQWAVKRFFDIVGALVGLLLTGIIFIFVAPQIYHVDPGPVIYSSIRIGKNGKPFRFYKFRSMYQDADKRKEELMKQNKMQGLMFKVDNDPRILPGIGEKIRKTSLDEFPQFWNVLKGDMSLVGTRPPTQDEWEQYGEEHRIRMTQRPGITGIWQVSGRSTITDFDEVVRMDERYIETWTLGMDFTIILKTIGKVFRREGAE